MSEIFDRAVAAAAQVMTDEGFPINDPVPGVDLLDEVEMRRWEVLKEAIRAALLVLREPTPEILNAFSDGDIESEKYWYIHDWKILMDEVLKE